MEHASFRTAIFMALLWNGKAVPQKTPKQKIPTKYGPNKMRTPYCSMYYPTANISWMAFTNGNLFVLFLFYFKPSPEITGAKAMDT